MTEKDKEFVGHIVRNLEAANQDVTKELMELVSQIILRQTNRQFVGHILRNLEAANQDVTIKIMILR